MLKIGETFNFVEFHNLLLEEGTRSISGHSYVRTPYLKLMTRHRAMTIPSNETLMKVNKITEFLLPTMATKSEGILAIDDRSHAASFVGHTDDLVSFTMILIHETQKWCRH